MVYIGFRVAPYFLGMRVEGVLGGLAAEFIRIKQCTLSSPNRSTL